MAIWWSGAILVQGDYTSVSKLDKKQQLLAHCKETKLKGRSRKW